MSAAAPLFAGCTSTTLTQVPPATVGATSLPAGTLVADLRFASTAMPGEAGGPAAPTGWPGAPAGYAPRADAKALYVAGTPSPATSAVPGTIAMGSYATNQRYVIKVPTNWNGKLIVAGTPSARSEFANDFIWGDFALANGYAYASSNKGIAYNAFLEVISSIPAASLNLDYPIPFNLFGLEAAKLAFRYGFLNQTTSIPAWTVDFATLTVNAKAFLQQYFSKAPSRTYAVGLSNGGMQVRYLLENYGNLVDGGVDWSGVFWSRNQNILKYLPVFLNNMPRYVASGYTDATSSAAIRAAGFPTDLTQASAAHPSLWEEYYSNQAAFYADLTVFVYALLIDSASSSSLASSSSFTPDPNDPVHLPGSSTTAGALALPLNRGTYVPSAAALANIDTFTHTGNIQKPLISIAGTADMFITVTQNATPYLNAVVANGKGSLYWQYLVSGGTHVDTFSAFGYGLQPQLPFAWAAFNQLVKLVETGARPAGAGTQQTVTSPSQIA